MVLLGSSLVTLIMVSVLPFWVLCLYWGRLVILFLPRGGVSSGLDDPCSWLCLVDSPLIGLVLNEKPGPSTSRKATTPSKAKVSYKLQTTFRIKYYVSRITAEFYFQARSSRKAVTPAPFVPEDYSGLPLTTKGRKTRNSIGSFGIKPVDQFIMSRLASHRLNLLYFSLAFHSGM